MDVDLHVFQTKVVISVLSFFNVCLLLCCVLSAMFLQ